MNFESSLPFILLLIVAIPLGFGLIWCAVSLLISWISGWRKLARYYRTDRKPSGKPLGQYWLMLGPASYRGVVTLHTAPEGLYLTIMVLFCLGHPNLLIPWSIIRRRGISKRGAFNWVTLDLGTPRITTMRLPATVVDKGGLVQFVGQVTKSSSL